MVSEQLEVILNLSKAAAKFGRKTDGQLSVHGLGFNDFIILYHLMRTPENKLRRIDLADLMGLTASGITRMLAPMEKIGLVSRESNAHDARISYVVLAPGGKRLYKESLTTAEHLAEQLLSGIKTAKLPLYSEVFAAISRA